MKRAGFHPVLCWFLAGATCGATPLISEFMADNGSILRDKDGQYSDWIEIYNPDGSAANMSGWYLTDDPSNKRMWAFPAVTIAARSNLVVFASGKNLTPTNGELHTNFSLKKGGEYLALVRPDGTNVVSEYNFPQQYEDTSYGTARQVTDVLWTDLGSFCRVWVPTNGVLSNTWRAASFVDSTWTTGQLAVGFFTNVAPDSLPGYPGEVGINVRTNLFTQRSSVYVRVPFVVADTGQVQGITLKMRFDDGFAFFLNGTWVVSSNAPATNALSDASTASAKHHPGAVETYDISTASRWLVPGTNVAAIHVMNLAVSNSDLFVLPQIVGALPAAEAAQTGYFAVPTPRQANGGNATLTLPQVPAFSVPSGVYTGSFPVTISGADTGLQIRYSLDGSIPATNSLLYSSALTVTTSQYIRAKVFATNGQSGPLATALYTFLDPNVRSYTSNVPLLLLRNVDPLYPGAVTEQMFNVRCYAQFVGVGSNGVAAMNTTPVLNSRCGINVRGSSSSGFAKRPYALELWGETDLDDNKSVLGMASESDWVLIGCYSYDRTYIYNALAFELDRQLGHWAPTGTWVEVYWSTNTTINVASNQYWGLYYLCEKVKISNHRVDVAGLNPWDTAYPECTGGYVIKVDRVPTADEDEYGWTTSRGYPTSSSLVITDPFKSALSTQQISYVTNYVQQFENVLFTQDAGNATTGYADWIDPASWIEYHWVNMLCKNPDMLRLSAYMHKDRSGRLRAGPQWDFDRCFSSYDGRSANPLEWYNGNTCWNYSWWMGLFSNTVFRQQHTDRWQQMRNGVFATTNLMALVDRYASAIGTNAATRDYIRWSMWPSAAHGTNYPGEIAYLKTWISNRVAWIDAQYAPPPAVGQTSAQVSAGFSFTLAGTTGTVYYTLDGSDPRMPDGTVNPAAIEYTGPVTIDATARLQARTVLDVTNWSSIASANYLVGESFAQTGDLSIVEINYNPLNASATERLTLPEAARRHFEFLEIRNVGTHRVNLDGMTLPDGRPAKPVTLSALSLDPGGRALVVANRRAFEVRYGSGLGSMIAGEWGTDAPDSGELSDNGEAIAMISRDGVQVQDFRYDNSGDWPGRPDGKGSTLEYTGADFAAASMTNPANWRSSCEIHGTPGVEGSGPYQPVVFNEVLTHTDLPWVDAIELFCSEPMDFDIGGWFVSDAQNPDSIDSYVQYQFPAGTYMPGGGQLTIDETDFNPNGLWNPHPGSPGPGEFALDAAYGDNLWLIRCDDSGQPAYFVDHVEFPAALNGVTYGSWPDGSPDWYRLSTQTLISAASGAVPKAKLPAVNAAPRVGPMLISEVQAFPAQAAGAASPFIELRNVGPTNENLGHWTLRGQADFEFPTNTIVAPGGFLVVVPFAPTNATEAEAFRTVYGVASGAVTLAGPWETGDVLSATGRVVLYRADEPPLEDPTLWPQTFEEEVLYTNSTPWPAGFDGAGFSLTRSGTNGIGRLPGSWIAEIPTPGSAAPRFDAWRARYLTGALDGDDDGDLYPNLYEYAAGTRPDSVDSNLLVCGFSGSGAGTTWWYRYRRTTLDRPDVTCTVQTSSNLITWTDVTDAAVSNGADYQIRSAGGKAFTNAPQIFLRLRVRKP